jgi:hypothetical protein
MSQAPGFSDVIARRTDAVVAVFRHAVGAGGVDERASATRSQRPRRIVTFTAAGQTLPVFERAAIDERQSS